MLPQGFLEELQYQAAKAPTTFGGKDAWRGSPTPDNLRREISFGNPFWGWKYSKCPYDGELSSFHHINGHSGLCFGEKIFSTPPFFINPQLRI
jgi:hypothetical protein